MIVLGLIVVGVVIAWLVRVLMTVRRNTPELQLRRMVGAEAAERLIVYEINRAPELSRTAAAAKALDRAIYDRGR